MKVFTKDVVEKLAKNGAATRAAQDAGKREPDHKPVIKLFGGQATWLMTESEPDDTDILFGLCNLVICYAELGCFRRIELEEIRFRPFGLGVERDKFFTAKYPISVYVKASRGHHITLDSKALEQASHA